MKPSITLIGLGNILMRDEGVGIHAIKYIQDNFFIPSDLQIVDGGTSGLDLLPFIEKREYVIFVDAVNFNREPGYIGVLIDGQIPALFGVKDSLHHMGLKDVLAAAQLLDRFPIQTCLVGIQPGVIDTGLELTIDIQARLLTLVDEIIAQIAAQGVFLQRCRERERPSYFHI